MRRTLLSMLKPLDLANGRSRGSIARANGNWAMIGSWWFELRNMDWTWNPEITLLQKGINWGKVNDLSAFKDGWMTNLVFLYNIPDRFPLGVFHIRRVPTLPQELIENRAIVFSFCCRYVSVFFRRNAHNVGKNGQWYWFHPRCLDERCIRAKVVVHCCLNEITW